MIAAPLPPDEKERLQALYETGLLDTEAEENFDELVQLAAAICGVPMTLVTLVDANRQWFKAKLGFEGTETPRELAFCAHAILQNGLFVVPNATEDERFFDNPFVLNEPFVRFYAGMPLATSGGHNLGTLCVIDSRPRTLTSEQEEALRVLGRQVATQIELHRRTRQLEKEIQEKLRYQQELLAANDRLQELAVTDALTRLRNRRPFRDQLGREIENSRRHDKPLSLMMIDVDNFKVLNDSYGHLAGDSVLIGIAEILSTTVRPLDLAARYGGEEFSVLMPGTCLEEAVMLGEHIRQTIATQEIAGHHPTVSIGISTLTLAINDDNGLIHAADDALYQAKRSGKNRVVSAIQ